MVRGRKLILAILCLGVYNLVKLGYSKSFQSFTLIRCFILIYRNTKILKAISNLYACLKQRKAINRKMPVSKQGFSASLGVRYHETILFIPENHRFTSQLQTRCQISLFFSKRKEKAKTSACCWTSVKTAGLFSFDSDAKWCLAWCYYTHHGYTLPEEKKFNWKFSITLEPNTETKLTSSSNDLAFGSAKMNINILPLLPLLQP